jgi:hypothetical protein
MSERRAICAHCIYWAADHGTGTVGHCHRFPPAVAVNAKTGTVVQKFPLTERGQWCGEWQVDEQQMVDGTRRTAPARPRSDTGQDT